MKDLIGHVAFGLHLVITNAVTVVSSLMLIATAKKFSGQRGLRWEGVLTVVLTVAVYCVAFLPGAVYFVGANFITEDPPGAFLVDFARFANNAVSLNLVSNFYIYTFTLASFRDFLRSIATPLLNLFKQRQFPEDAEERRLLQ